MLDVAKWTDDRLQHHISICQSVLRVNPWHKAAMEQFAECDAELKRRRTPREPDICDLIREESE